LNLLPPPPRALIQRLRLSSFYRQHKDALGIPVLASERVSPYALCEAAYLVERLLEKRRDLARQIAITGVRVAILAASERTTDIPEHSDLTPKDYWDRRARGLGATPARPAVSGAEENLLAFPGDPYAGECIFLHEFCHVIDELALRPAEPGFEAKLKAVYDAAMKAGLWKATYAATSPSEYWAEGAQSYFDCNQKPGGIHNDINTREKLKTYDPALFSLLDMAFKKTPWRYESVERRLKRDHLRGWDPKIAPRFSWKL
jgi:hypothetical protein